MEPRRFCALSADILKFKGRLEVFQDALTSAMRERMLATGDSRNPSGEEIRGRTSKRGGRTREGEEPSLREINQYQKDILMLWKLNMMQ